MERNDLMAVATLDMLLSATGQELLGELAREAPEGLDPPGELALAGRLRARFPAGLVAAALHQHALRLRAQTKWSRAGRMWLTREGLEQASGEAFARHRAVRYAVAGCRQIIDLCAGIGGDLTQLAPGREAVAVDRDPVHLRMAVLNARVYGAAGVQAVRADVRTLRLERAGPAAVFADPARRDPATGRRFAPGVAEPPLAWCVALAGRLPSGMVAIKAAPGLPLDLIPPGWEVEFVASGRELREAVLWSPALATTARRATILGAGSGPASAVSLTADDGPPVPCGPPGAWLLDPNPAVTRAGLVETLARQAGAWKLDPRIAFLSADHPFDTPFGRVLAVDAALPWNLKRLRAALRARHVGSVDLRKRGSAVDVDALRRRLDLDGDHHAVVVLTRVANRPWALICHDPRAGDPGSRVTR